MFMENINFYTITALACLSWVVTNFQPLHYLINRIPRLENKYTSFIQDAVVTLLKCTTCFSFWFSWFMTSDFYVACIICVLATFLSNNLSKTKI